MIDVAIIRIIFNKCKLCMMKPSDATLAAAAEAFEIGGGIMRMARPSR